MIELHICSRKSGSLLKAFAIGDANEILIGRDEACDVKIRARGVSREHCTIERSGDEMILRDLDSSGGTYVQGERVKRIALRDGMEIVIGPAALRYVDNRPDLENDPDLDDGDDALQRDPT